MPAKERNPENRAHIPAKRVFTDRDEPRRAFAEAYEAVCRHPADYKVVHYYGRGGIGKSCLLRFLYAQMREEKAYTLFYDMEEGTEMRRILTRLRNKLMQEYPDHFSFDFFDLALLKYSELAGERNELVEKEDETIIESNPILSALLDGVALIPGISVVSTVIEHLTKGYHHVKDISDYVKKLLVEKAAKLESMQLADLLDKLPEYFSEDLAKSCKKLDKPLVLFLDTYEQFVNYMNDVGVAGEEDRWLRDTIIQYTPNSVWVIAGRDRLRWREIDKNWTDDPDYSDHMLGHLARVDAIRFLQTADIDDEKLCGELYELTDGDPLYLDISVSTWQDLKAAGKTPAIDDFGNEKQLVSRYLRYMDSAHKDMVELLACFGKWTDEEAKEKIPKIAGSFSRTVYDTIVGSTLVQSDGAGGYYLHRVVREAILGQIPEKEMKEVSEKLSVLSGETEKKFSLEYVAALDIEVDRLIEGLKHGADVSVKSIRDMVKTLKKQGNEREILRALLPLFRYEESVDFKDTQVYRVLSDFLSAHVAADSVPQHLERSGKVYEAYVRNGVTGMPRETIAESYLYSLMNNGRFEEALKLAGAEKERLEAEGRADNYYTEILVLIGSVYSRQRRFSEAAEVLEKAYGLQKKLVEEKKRSAGNVMNVVKNLAFVTRQMKKPERSLELDQELMRMYTESYGEDSLFTLSSKGDIAMDYRELGQHEKAEALMGETLAVYEKKHGSMHTFTLAAVSRLGNILFSEKKYAEARDVYKSLYEKRLEKYGKLHPDTCTSLCNYADAVHWAGDKAEGKRLHEEALECMHKVYGENAPELRPVLFGLKGVYAEGEEEKGIEVCREGLEIMRRYPYLQENRPNDLVHFAKWLGYYLRRAKRFAEAEAVDREQAAYLQEHQPE
ncbi:MAG: tetratricopeptide repeat protein [Lachnospiraceae bacterium]|nr:tetratricopeptide repeat protein [Lachnospiraceae bacterium]